jgi:hypothetical protein
MDDQQTYLLNGLLARQFGLGRILRFRQVNRGRQPTSFELLTAQQNEYLVSLYSPGFRPDHLSFVAETVNVLDAERFTVVPFLLSKQNAYVAEGPQGAHLLVSTATAGSPLPPDQYTDHDISQVGLRLAWMHRLLNEKIELPVAPPPAPAALLEDLFDDPTPDAAALLDAFSADARKTLLSALALPNPVPAGWVHGDIQPNALLHDADRQLRTVVDWALLHIGFPHEDLIDAILTLCGDNRAGFNPARAAVLLEAYDSLSSLKSIPWTPIVAAWCARRFLDAAAARRPAPPDLLRLAAAPERLAVALASCLA